MSFIGAKPARNLFPELNSSEAVPALRQTRTKSISIRVSTEERRILRQACDLGGMHSISEFARVAMHRVIESKGFAALANQDIQFWLEELSCRLTSLQSEVERLRSTLRVEPE